MNTAASTLAPAQSETTDRVGIVASSLCAVHCLLTPVLLIFAKDFAGIWAHPSAHWILAAVTIPLAIRVIAKGSRQHGKAWVICCAGLGATLIFASLLAPMLAEPAAAGAGTCENGCCPSVSHSADGAMQVNFPLESLLSIFGGLFLIAGHVGNLFYNRCHLNDRRECAC